MKFIKNIWDFFANWIRRCQREHCPRGYVRVSAKTLADICECINPSYSHLAEYARQELSNDYLDSPGFAHTFYSNRAAFFASVANLPAYFYNHLMEKYSPEKEKERFHSMVAAAKLQEHILLSEEGTRKAINFEKIMVDDDIQLNLGGIFRSWKFNCVKFCGAVALNIYPPSFNSSIGEMVFNKSVCFGNFECWFFGVPDFYISDSKFMSSFIMDTGSDTQLGAYGQVDDMEEKFFQHLHTPTIRFFHNSFKGNLMLFANAQEYRGKASSATLGRVHFSGGNYISELLSLPALYPESNLVNVDIHDPVVRKDGRLIKVYDIQFDNRERIKMPSHPGVALQYKEFFIALKKQAIEKRDRDAELKYGRKERYFDRGLATYWEDKFILDWSYYASDGGISWFRPIGLLILVQTGLAAAFICSGWCDWNWWVWGKLAVESLDPLSHVESGCASPLSAAVYGVARKIFLFLFLYEIIKVFRRFSNKPFSE